MFEVNGKRPGKMGAQTTTKTGMVTKGTYLQYSNSLDREGHRSGTNSGDSCISFISLGDDITGAQNNSFC